ncbi:MAG: hypothetical protein R2939_20785 [Kofleriaceae bacterium]
MDLYAKLLRHALFPAYEGARGRPTATLLRSLERTQWAPAEELAAIQAGFLRRLVHHAYAHTAHYRQAWDALGVTPGQLASAADLAALPLLEREDARASAERRVADVPPRPIITKSTSGSTGRPVTIRYNAESRHWRDADRWRGYGWAGYRVGDRALHYWGAAAAPAPRLARAWAQLDHALKRDRYLDCGRGDPAALDAVVATVERFRPHVLVAFSQAAARLARHVIATGRRTWDPIPVICGAEKVWPADRATIEAAFGPVFETYGSREVQLIGAECDVHDGLHVSVEKLVVEVIVREDGRARPARAGEVGEVVVTDLHNLAAPLIRYVTGDLAVARTDEPCRCGRTLPRIGLVEGRVTDTLRDGAGNPVSGLVFNVLMVTLAEQVAQFQVVQDARGAVTLKLVPAGATLAPAAEQLARSHAARYLPGVPLHLEVVDDIPTSAAGKRRVVVVEPPAAG